MWVAESDARGLLLQYTSFENRRAFGKDIAFMLATRLLYLCVTCWCLLAVPAAAQGLMDADVSDQEALQGLRKIFVGDLDVMEEQRVVRILTVYGPGRFHLENGLARGMVPELAARFEQFLNAHLGKGHLKVYAMLIPVSRDELIPALLDGRGDLVVADLTITEARASEVDFSIPFSKP